MNKIFCHQKVSGLLSLAAVAVFGSGMPANGQTIDTAKVQESIQPFETETSPDQISAKVTAANNQNVWPESSASTPTFSNQDSVSNHPQKQEQFSAIAPVPGTVGTSSTALAPDNPQPTSQTSTSSVAQADIGIAQPTRGGSSYIGIGANIGISGGDSALGDGNFMVISKIGFTNALSVRPSAILGDNTVFLIPLSYDFSFQQVGDPLSDPLPIAPYIGAGAAIKTGDDSQVAVLVSGGIDVPLNSQFTATAAVNAAFFDETDIGLSIGVGYNFRGLGF